MTDGMTAAAVGSGDVPVLATPWVAALVERAAVAAVANAGSPPGTTTVGVSITIEHTAPTPVGATVRATAVLTEVAGRRLRFTAVVRDSGGEIATSSHERVLVDRERFESTARDRYPK